MVWCTGLEEYVAKVKAKDCPVCHLKIDDVGEIDPALLAEPKFVVVSRTPLCTGSIAGVIRTFTFVYGSVALPVSFHTYNIGNGVQTDTVS